MPKPLPVWLRRENRSDRILKRSDCPNEWGPYLNPGDKGIVLVVKVDECAQWVRARLTLMKRPLHAGNTVTTHLSAASAWRSIATARAVQPGTVRPRQNRIGKTYLLRIRS